MSVATLGCFVASLVPKFDSPKFRPIRGVMFLITGMSTMFIFVSIWAFMNEWKVPVNVTVFAVGGYLYV
jgi:predicted membrane channel-forming protein YqfA (hemolysin III family)